jgi:hypothetical protein
VYPIAYLSDFFGGKSTVPWHYDLHIDRPVDEKPAVDKCLVGDPEAKFERQFLDLVSQYASVPCLHCQPFGAA